MFIDTKTQNLQGETAAKARQLKRGISGLALALALSSPAWGQTTPADPECALNGEVVTCEGNVASGVLVVETDGASVLNIQNLTANIAPVVRTNAISFIRDTGDIEIKTLASDFDIQLIDFSSGIFAQSNGGKIRIDNALNISTAAGEQLRGVFVQSSQSVDPNNRADVEILNNGNIDILRHVPIGGSTLANDEVQAGDAIAIWTANPGTYRITNHGMLTLRQQGCETFCNTAGILFRASDITSEDGNIVQIDAVGPIALSIFNDAPILLAGGFFSRGISIIGNANNPFESIFIDNRAAITGLSTNSGIAISASADLNSETAELLINNSGDLTELRTGISVSGGELGITRVQNSGNISASSRGIYITNPSDLGDTTRRVGNPYASYNVENSGDIVAQGDDELEGALVVFGAAGEIINSGNLSAVSSGIALLEIAVDEGQTDALLSTNPDFNSRIFNSGNINSSESNAILNITFGTTDITNEGDINNIANDFSAVFAESMTNLNMDNSGSITASGDNSHGVDLNEISVSPDGDINRVEFDIARDLEGSMALSNSGAITASGVDSDGVRVTTASDSLVSELPAYDFFTGRGDMFAALYDPTTLVTNTAGGTITGGSGTGAGVRFMGPGTHTLDNRGTITAASGIAVAGGDGEEVIVNRGALDGSVSLGAGDDQFTLFASGTQGSVEGGTGSDSFILDGAADESGIFNFGTSNVTGFESFIKRGGGVWTLSGVDGGALPRLLSVQAGTLLANANAGGLNVNIETGAALGGNGTLGNVTIASGATLSPGGTDIGTLNFNSLVLADGALLRFDLGAPDVVGGTNNDLIEIAGDLTLDGTLDIFSTPDFGEGLYRLFNYGGALTDNGLEVGMTPEGIYEVQTGIAGQVNLLVSVANLQFWDGPGAVGDGNISGGTGVWTVPSTNWTNSDGTENGDFSGAFAIFMGTAGTVTVEGTQGVTGMQFASDGYVLEAGTDGAVSLNDAESFIRVDPGFTASLDVPLVGDGRLVKRDTGTLILSGTNTHAGGTEVREGVVQITDDDNLGAAGAAFIFNGGTLRAGGALTLAREMSVADLGGTLDDSGNAITLSGALTGGGTLTKTGSGALTLSGDSSAFAGDFMLSAGSMQLDGMLGGLLNVAAGSTLSGIGTAGNLDISGTLAVGASIGTLTTTGDVIFRAGSDFQVELAADGTNDLLNVGGAATIEGGTLSIFTLDPETVYTDGQTYTVLTAAGGLTGQFDQLVETSAFLDFTADYQANDLVITLEEVLTFPDVANTFNQTQASAGLMELGQIVGSDSLAVYNALLILDGNSARNAFDLSSGEIYAGIVAADQRQARAQSDKLVAGAWRSGKDGLGAWGNVSVQDGNTDLDGNGADLGFDRQSIDLGIDYRGDDNKWVAGVTAGWSNGDVTLAARNSAAETDSWQMGAYGRVGTGREGFSAGGAVNLSQGNTDVARNIRFGSINRTATSSTDTDTTSLAAEGRYGNQIGTSNWVAGPIASVLYANTDLDEFSETGADALNLSGTAKTKASVYGAGLFANWQSEKGFLDASVQYGSGDLGRAQASLRLDGASSAPFLVRAAEHDNDHLITKVSGAVELGNNWSLAANARAEWASKDTNISAGITARKTF